MPPSSKGHAPTRHLSYPKSGPARLLFTGALLILTSVYATWPLLPRFGQFVYLNDPMISAWGLWWVKEALINAENPWWTTEILAPQGAYLSFHALMPLLGTATAPLTAVLGAGFTYNVLKLVLPPVAAVGTYLLARNAGFERPPAALAGFLFGFSTIVVWRTSLHMNLGAGLAVLPYAVAFAARFEKTERKVDAVLAGAALGATALIDPTLALFAGVAVALWIATSPLTTARWRPWRTASLIVVAVAVLVASPQLLAMYRAWSLDAYTPNPEALAATWVETNASLLAMLTPANVREWVPGHLETLAYRFPRGEATPAYGWGALGLAVMGAMSLIVRRMPPAPRLRRPIVWALALFLLGTLLALGPEITIADEAWTPLPVKQHGQTISVVMPYTWLVQVPLLSDVRVPARFVMLGALGLALLAGAGFARMWRIHFVGRVLALVLVCLAVSEAGFPDGAGGARSQWVPISRDQFYEPIRGDQRTRSIVVDIPMVAGGATSGIGRPPDQFEPVLRATQHGHPIASGYVTRIGQERLTELSSRPFYAAVLALQGASADDVTPPPPLDANSVRRSASAMNVGWAVVWPQAPPRIKPFLEGVGFRFVHRMDGVALYQLPD